MAIKKRKKSSLWRSFGIWVFAAVLVSFAIEAISVVLLVRVGIIKELSVLPMINLPATAFLISMLTTLIVGRFYLAPIDRISNAMSTVASGDFSVRMDDKALMSNIQRMNTNFNKMVRELDSTEMLKSDFITDVSHEFKTPIAAIEGYTSLLTATDLTQEQKGYVDHILAGTTRLSSLTGNILRLSKLEKQQFHQEKNTFSLDEQIRQSILMFEQSWSGKELEINPELDTVLFCGYEELLDQVWMNLISNAIKFTPQGGRLGFELHEDESGITVRVSDSGIGMSEEECRHAFDKFYQAENNHSVAGNGLGLAIVNQIVAMHGGQIRIESEPGKGSTFIVNLPKS